MNRWTCVFLVLLRIAIGWHFYVEGRDKLASPTWTSAPYLREASGPLAGRFQDMAGDPVLDRLTPPPGTAGPQLPSRLVDEWHDYLDAFTAHYQLTPKQRAQAEIELAKQDTKTAEWLYKGRKTVSITQPWGPPIDKERTTLERLEDYRAQLEAARRQQRELLGYFGKGAESQVNAAKADARRAGADLQKELDAETQALKDALRTALTPEQLAGPDLPEPVRPPVSRWSMLDRADFSVKYGLLIVGGCLLLGLLTRPACVVGAGLLLMFYLAMPPVPGVPDNPKAEGHYLFINKNIIEMLALLVLATVPTGRWVGLDGLVHALNPLRRWRAASVPAAAPNVPKIMVPAPPPERVAAVPPSAPTEASSHGA